MFVVCGEALMDVFAEGETPTGMTMDARIGGSPFNVALGLARLAKPVSFFGALGSGFLGQRLMRALRHEGIGTACTPVIDAPTTLGLVGLDERGVPSYSFYGEGCADRLLPMAALERLPADARAFHFGSYAMVVEPVAATQRALVEREHGRSLIAYDPNIRLNVEPDLQRWRDTLAWMLPRTHLLKVSDEDLGLLFPGADVDALARSWLAAGVGLVVVTRGGEGAEAWAAGVHLRSAPQRVTVVDTVGAGDTFQAALLTWLAERGRLAPQAVRDWTETDLASALDFAGRAAAITCSRRGADLPRRVELD
ncbi:MAG: carbohydrate kinase [Burkholderiales bacterium]|nr:carbohydrate kinase [Burkholderiales bacterium]MDE2397117.1 carbohydrate kinase [Burkholderiales bacterium]MDE2452337.1 carbohydrate kinase [Burkholderiales bacterium]